jgi:hypothetical protein
MVIFDMYKMKVLITIWIAILFIGLMFNPVSAKINVDEKLEIGFFGEKGKFLMKTFQRSSDEIEEYSGLLNELMDRMQSSSDYGQMIEVVNSFRSEWGRYPILKLLLSLIEKILEITHNLNQLRPLRNNAFILSWGYGPKFNPLKENNIKLFLPMMSWYYKGRGNFVNSRTLIVDPYPFDIKSLTGRQFGLMNNFAGIYIYRHSTLTDHTYTFILGRVGAVRGFDLSPFNVWNQ